MGRPPSIARDELLERVAEHVAQSGIAGSTFRSIAQSLGISTMPLVSYFGSKEQLIAEVVSWSEARQREIVRRLDSSLDALVEYWAWTITPGNMAYVRLEFELGNLESLSPDRWGPAMQRAFRTWLEAIAHALEGLGLTPPEAALEAGLLTAIMIGLQFDLMLTGDTERTTGAFHTYVGDLRTRLPRPMSDAAAPASEVG